MSEEKLNQQEKVQQAQHNKNSELISTEIYNSETTKAHINKNMFVSSEMLDRALSVAQKQEVVLLIDRMNAKFEQLRDVVMTQLGKRQTSVGKGFRNYGFMIAANQSMNNFPQFSPNFIDNKSFNDVIEDYLFLKDVSERMLAMTNYVRDMMNIMGNFGFDFAFAYYSNVKSIVNRTDDQTAINVFNILQRFFNQRRTPISNSQPTEMQLEKDFKTMLHANKEGKIVIEPPQTVEGEFKE